MAKFVNIDRDTPMLLPPDMRDWVPSNHLVHFMIDAIESVDPGDAASRLKFGKSTAMALAGTRAG